MYVCMYVWTNYNNRTQQEKKASLFGLVRVFIGELGAIYLCRPYDHALIQLIDEFQAQLSTVLGYLMLSMLHGNPVTPMTSVDQQQCSLQEKMYHALRRRRCD